MPQSLGSVNAVVQLRLQDILSCVLSWRLQSWAAGSRSATAGSAEMAEGPTLYTW